MDMARRAKEIASIFSALAHLVPSGGGSGDFTKATITLVDPDGEGYSLEGAFIDAENEQTKGHCYTDDADSIDIVLYKGKAHIDLSDDPDAVSVSGNAEKDVMNITVTGDCTITVTA